MSLLNAKAAACWERSTRLERSTFLTRAWSSRQRGTQPVTTASVARPTLPHRWRVERARFSETHHLLRSGGGIEHCERARIEAAGWRRAQNAAGADRTRRYRPQPDDVCVTLA